MKILGLDTAIDGIDITKLAAIRNGEMLGTIELLYVKRRIAAIRRLYVHPDHRLQKIGRKLVEECCEIALAEGGCEAVSLLVRLDNFAARDFYKKLGFTCVYQDDSDWILSKPLA